LDVSVDLHLILTVFSDSSVLGVEEYVMDAVAEHNKLAASVDTSVDFTARY